MAPLKLADQMPGNFGLPFLGETLELFSKEELYYWEHYQRYGSIFKTRVLGLNLAFLIGTEANRQVLLEKADCFSNSLGWNFLKPLFGNGILMQDGAEHVRTRRLMYPAFHSRAIATYFDTVWDTVAEFIDDWGKQGTVPLTKAFRQLTLAVASKLFLGTRTARDVKQTSEWFRELSAGRLALLHLDLPITLYGRSQQARRQLRTFLREVIAERQQQGNLEECKDVLGLLLAAVDEDGNRLSIEEVLDQSLLILFAGHETTATLMSWAIYELGNSAEWRDRLHQEQQQIVGDAPLRVEHLKQLTQMTNVLKEAERLYPPVYGIPRGVVQDFEYGGYLIPAGWYVDVSPMLTHRLPELYTLPDQFDPDRFAPPREEDKKHPLALVGFGNGIHSCLGFEFAQMEMKVILSQLIRKYDWTVSPAKSTLMPIHRPSKVQDALQLHITSQFSNIS